MPKISVILGYYERPSQFKVTLDSYAHWYSGRDYEYIVIDDGSKHPIEKLLESYSSKLNIVYEIVHRDVHLNPGLVYNLAASKAKSEILFLSNPENCHLGDVLGKVEEFATDHRYLCFACASLSTIDMFSEILLNPKKYFLVLDSLNGFYQHSEYTNRLLHFASAITKKDWDRIGGFDPIFNDGCAFEDNDLVEKLVRDKFEFFVFDNPMVGHIPHLRFTNPVGLAINEKVFLNKWGHTPRDKFDGLNMRIFK